MYIIFINGLPRSGKTETAHILERKIENCEVIHLDHYGTKTPPIPYSKKQEIYNIIKDYPGNLAIIEGLTWDQEFITEITQISDKTNSNFFYFDLRREFSEILKMPSAQERNDEDKLKKIITRLESLDVPNKKIISNKTPQENAKLITLAIPDLL